MLIKLETPAIFGKAIELISEFVTEARIKLNDYGLSITAMDPANVSMIGYKIPKSAFSQFEGGQETLGVNLENLKKILRRASAGSAVILKTKENVLDIQIEDRIKRHFTLGLLEVETEDIIFEDKVSRMEFTNTVELASTDFIDAIDDASIVGDACTFQIEEGKFILEAKNLNSARAEFSEDEASISAEPSKARYSLEYLQKFTKGAKLCEKTRIQFAQDHPLKIDFRAPNMELSFVLAPRVETED